MRVIWVIAKNTYREIMRDRILYGLLIFAVLLIGLSLALGQLTFSEQARITTDFGFTAIQLSAAILSMFVGATLVSREIEKKTIMTLLVRPISRPQFICGKTFGLIGVIAVSVGLLALVLAGILTLMHLPLNIAFFAGLYGVMLEAAVLLAITIFFGCFSTPVLSVSFTLAMFLIGHWLESLSFFAAKSENPGFIWFTKIVRSVIPNMEMFNWRSLFVYNEEVPWADVSMASVYALAWFTFLITLAAFILRRRDLG